MVDGVDEGQERVTLSHGRAPGIVRPSRRLSDCALRRDEITDQLGEHLAVAVDVLL